MRVTSTLVNYAFAYVIKMSKLYNIDESHALRHSMDVFNYANQIYDSELPTNPLLHNQKDIIMSSAILHDMCDKKYIDEKNGLLIMNNHFRDHITGDHLNTMNAIISSMSYSKVKQTGFPQLGEYELAYHIVRESDLLAAYDVERCIIYQMMHENYTYKDSITAGINLFNKRVFRYISDNLFVTDFSKNESKILHETAEQKIKYYEQLYNSL